MLSSRYFCYILLLACYDDEALFILLVSAFVQAKLFVVEKWDKCKKKVSQKSPRYLYIIVWNSSAYVPITAISTNDVMEVGREI